MPFHRRTRAPEKVMLQYQAATPTNLPLVSTSHCKEFDVLAARACTGLYNSLCEVLHKLEPEGADVRVLSIAISLFAGWVCRPIKTGAHTRKKMTTVSFRCSCQSFFEVRLEVAFSKHFFD